jgi:predicted nucleic acid-binding protein
MNVLVDSSVWVGHFKLRNDHLVELLGDGAVICHPYIVGEVACGTPPSRKDIIGMLAELESAPVATQEELLVMMDTRHLYGRGCGFVDMSLLASSLLSETALIWTLDKRLEVLAGELNRAYRPKLHS